MPKQLAQRDAPGDRDIDPDGWHELAVANPTFLLVRLGSECTDVQGLRELTVNGLGAIAALGAHASGRVVWDLDWERFDASAGRVRKLSVIDTGTGMTADQLRYYINQLAASGREQSCTGNFGVGAKVAAGSRNPHALEYRSWHEGHGSLVCFKRHPDGRWGLEPQRWTNGHTDFWRPLGEADKPWLLRGQAHGTQVVLLGQHERHDTTHAPRSVTEGRQHWITRYLNGRFLRLPERVEVLVRDHHGRDEPGQLREIRGESHHVEQRAQDAGTVELSDAIAHWWVLDDDHRGRRREACLWASSGHVATVFDDELCDVLPQTRGGYGRLQDFGIRFGYERVILHLEPHVQAGRLEANTARTLLLLDHQPLPWSRSGEEFAAAMPREILRLQERAASADGVPRREAIRNRVSAIMPLYRLSRYRPTQPTRQASAESAASSAGDEPAGRPATPPQARSAPPTAESVHTPANGEPAHDGSDGEPRADHTDHDPGSDTAVDLPDVAWVSARDGSRAPGDPEDQAARYYPARHELTINADFRAITDLTAHWRGRYRAVPGAQTVIEAHVREWCEQILVEVVLAARSSSWTPEQLDALLSPASLTAPAAAPPAARDASKASWPEARSATKRPRRISRGREHRTAVPYPVTPTGRCADEPADARRADAMSPIVPEPARRLAAELELRFARDAQLTTQLGDVRQQRLQRFNDPLWTDMDPDGIATIHGEHPAAVQIAVAHNRSETLDAPNPLLEAQDAHWPIQHAVIDRQSTAARRRQLAGAGWSENDARGASVRELTCAEGLGGSGS